MKTIDTVLDAVYDTQDGVWKVPPPPEPEYMKHPADWHYEWRFTYGYNKNPFIGGDIITTTGA